MIFMNASSVSIISFQKEKEYFLGKNCLMHIIHFILHINFNILFFYNAHTEKFYLHLLAKCSILKPNMMNFENHEYTYFMSHGSLYLSLILTTLCDIFILLDFQNINANYFLHG